jgi:hypothetical protein
MKTGCCGGYSCLRGTKLNGRGEKRRLESFIIYILSKMSESIGGECGMHMEDDIFLKHVILKVECCGIILKWRLKKELCTIVEVTPYRVPCRAV